MGEGEGGGLCVCVGGGGGGVGGGGVVVGGRVGAASASKVTVFMNKLDVSSGCL